MDWKTYVDETVAEVTRLRQRAQDVCLTEKFDTAEHSTKIEVGTRVGYAKRFLRSIFASATDRMWFARGKVLDIVALSPECQLARIEWEPIADAKGKLEDADMPARVHVANLAKVGPNLEFCEA
jgi:hypothetical protein